jgi:hypothetical protein
MKVGKKKTSIRDKNIECRLMRPKQRLNWGTSEV